MQFFIRNKQEMLFWGVAVLLLILTVAIVISSLRFLVNEINEALGAGLEQGTFIIRFDIDALREIIERREGIAIPEASL
jgi:hypothetical protein